jgi:DNA invertase Pin-like site-specific DNA recombinase
LNRGPKDYESSNHEELDKRPELSRLFNEIKNGVVKHLFVYDQSRLSRNDTVSSIFRIECAKQGVTLYNKEGKYDLSDHNDHFMKQILDAVAQFDNAQRAERTRLGKLARIRQGNWLGGPPPYGYEIRDHRLVINEEEAKWVRFIYQKYANRIPLIDVKFELDTQGVQPRRKGGTWTLGSLNALLRNTHYIDFWNFKDGKTGEEIRVECPRILSADLWASVQKTKSDHLSKRNSTNAVKHFYMLKNVLRCGHCGTWLSGVMNPKQPGKNHYYCPKKERVWTKQKINLDDKWKRGRVCALMATQIPPLMATSNSPT